MSITNPPGIPASFLPPGNQPLNYTSNSSSNYRPISLLCLISKLLEKHIHSILSDFCMSLELISPFQFGFLPQRSTVSALLFSTHSIISLLESNPSVCGVFLDLKKSIRFGPSPTPSRLTRFTQPPSPSTKLDLLIPPQPIPSCCRQWLNFPLSTCVLRSPSGFYSWSPPFSHLHQWCN